MQEYQKVLTKRNVWLAVIGALIMVYPNLVYIPWHMEWPCVQENLWIYWSFHVFRFLYFATLILLIYRLNVVKGRSNSPHPVLDGSPVKDQYEGNGWIVGRHVAMSIGVSAVAYGLFAFISLSLSEYGIYDRLASFTILKFIVICGLGILMSRITLLREERVRMVSEVAQLRAENLQSKYAALAGQVNPHFFFNSLSGIASLVRGGDNKRTLEYIDELSDVFRYTLQSSDKGMVPLSDELEFAESFRYVLEVRYAGKLTFDIQIDNQHKTLYMLPVLTLLPIIENVIVHNCIDSAHTMTIHIGINEHGDLVVSNPVHPKHQQPVTNGTGLRNLANRLELMCGRKLRVENSEGRFTVYVPLKN